MIRAIVKVGFAPAKEFPDLSLPLAGNIVVSPQWVWLADVASFSEESSSGNVEVAAKCSLEFKSLEDIPLNMPVGFIIVDGNGNSYCIGSRPPHCGVLKKVNQFNLPSGAASINYYSFSFPLAAVKL